LERDISRSRQKEVGKVARKGSRAVKLHAERAEKMVIYFQTRNNFKKESKSYY
jgi:hypothetical protein